MSAGRGLEPRATRDCTARARPARSPPLRPPVLEPGFDLRVSHFERLGQGGAFGRGQVLLAVEALLQLADLQACERRARLLLLGGCPVLIGVTYTACYSEG